jgi:hypothetical protein
MNIDLGVTVAAVAHHVNADNAVRKHVAALIHFPDSCS